MKEVTYHEFLAMLSEDEAKLYSENLSNEPNSDVTRDSILPPADFIWSGFCWGETPQGNSFWRNIAKRFIQ